MEIYDDTDVCRPVPEPAPVCAPEPAALPAFEPPAPAAPAPEMTFPAEPPAPVPAAPAAPAAPVFDAPAHTPEPQPVAAAPLSSGTLLGPSTVGGGTDDGSWVGGAPDLSGSATIGGGAADLSASGFVGGGPELGASGFVGGSPDLGGSTTIGGPTDLGMTWVDADGNPVDAPHIPVVPGPFNAAAAGIVDANNAAIARGWLGGGADPYPSFLTPGFDSDKDGVLNEHDADPRDRFKR